MRNSSSRLSASQTTGETRWTRGAQLTLVAATLFIMLNIAQIVYRFTIPSLGWAGNDPDTEETTPEFRLEMNAVGASSPIEAGDTVRSIDSISATQILNQFPTFSLHPENWEVGGEVLLSVDRDGQPMGFKVQLVHWTPVAWWQTNLGRFNGILNWLVTMLLLGAGTFTFLNRPSNLAARFLFAFGIANLSITLGDSIPDYIALYIDPIAGMAKAFFSNIVFAYLLAPSFLGFALTFPHPKSLIQRQSSWLLVPYLVGSITIILLFIAPEYATIGFLLTFMMLLLGVLALLHSGITMRDAVSRAQLRWAIGGVTIGVMVFMLNFASNVPSPYREIILGVARLGQPIVGFSLAIAILRYRLFDIDLIIRKTLQYTLLTGLLALVYFGSVVLLQSLTENLFGEQSPLVIVFSTLVVAALFNPLRIRIQDFIDRRFFRRKYDAEQTLANFAAIARDEVDIDQLTIALMRVVGETIQPEKVGLFLTEMKSKGYHE